MTHFGEAGELDDHDLTHHQAEDIKRGSIFSKNMKNNDLMQQRRVQKHDS